MIALMHIMILRKVNGVCSEKSSTQLCTSDMYLPLASFHCNKSDKCTTNTETENAKRAAALTTILKFVDKFINIRDKSVWSLKSQLKETNW